MAPLLIIGGGAGSGKDTVGAMIAEKTGGQCIALADPMKRLVMPLFDFSETTLWGPSEARNVVDHRYTKGGAGYTAADMFNAALERFAKVGADWCVQELHTFNPVVYERLNAWLIRLAADHLQSGKPFTARTALQTLGTECGRNLDKDFWVSIARGVELRLLSGDCFYNRLHGVMNHVGEAPPAFVITTDGRFPNEISEKLSRGGQAILVEPPGGNTLDAGTQAAGVKNHASETNLSKVPRSWWGHVVVNDKSSGLDHLNRTIDGLAERLTHGHLYL